MSCIASASLFLKWNRGKLDSFTPKRGSRQCNPMSPYIFVLCLEKLALLIQEKVWAKKWLPVKISKEGSAIISHLFFVDDCLFLTQAKASQVKLVKDVVHTFYLASGSKVNMHKSWFLPSTNVARTKVAQSVVHFKSTYQVGKYLG